MIENKVNVILGSSGFIGQSLIKFLACNNKKTIAFSRKEIQNKYSNIEYLLVESYFDIQFPSSSIVFHFAENSNIKEVELKGKDYIKESIDLVNNIFAKKPQNFIYASSSAVYDDQRITPYSPDENIIYNKSIYAQSKLAIENIVTENNFINVRLANIYGLGMSKSNIFNDILAQLNNTSVTINEPGPERDYLWIDDLIEILYIISNSNEKGIFNLASGESISTEKLCKLILKVAGKEDSEIKYRFPHRRSSIYIDILKTKNTFNWKPKISLEDGIKILIGIKNEK